MRIAQVELENVKSYEYAALVFTPGTNAICGHNGAGKSTALEAVGFALFDYLATNQAQFVREGEKVATVTVHLVDRDDRVYHVVRKCGSVSQHYVYDPEIDQKLTEGKGDTLAWLNEFLGVEERTDLAALFRDAVGVPQGLLTAAFLETPARRKDTFNPLLRVDEYERVWAALREPGRYLQSALHEMEKRVAGLEAEVKALPGLQEKAVALDAGIAADAERHATASAELDAATREKDALEAAKALLEACKQTVAEAEGEVKALEARLADTQAAVERARAAQTVVEESAAAHAAYTGAQVSLDALETERQARDQLKETLQSHETALALARQQVERGQAALAEVAAAESEMAALAPQVAEQERIEAELAAAERAAARLTEAERNLAQEREQQAALETRLGEVQRGLETLTRLEAELATLREELATREAQWDALRERLAGLEAELGQLEAQTDRAADRVAQAERRLAQERKQLAALESKQADIQAGLVALAEAEQQRAAHLAELEDLDAQHHAGTAQVAAQQAELEQLQAQIEILAAAETAQCPVCDHPLTPEHRDELLQRQRARQETVAAARQAAQAELDALVKARKQTQKALAALERQVKALPRPGDADEIAAQVAAQQETARQSETALAAERSDAATLAQRRAEVEAALTDLRPQVEAAQQARAAHRQAIAEREARCKALPRPAEEAELAARIAALRERAQTLEAAVAELTDAPAEVARLQAKAEALGNPRRAYQRAADSAARRPALEKEQAAAEAQIAALTAQVAEVAAALAAYADLDARIAARRAALATHAAAHQQYLEHVREAETLAERTEKVAALAGELAQAQAARDQRLAERDSASAEYDAGAYTQAADAITALRAETATLAERLRQQRAQQAEAQADIERLAAVQAALDAAQAEGRELDALLALVEQMRRVLRDAGPKVTQALVEVISLQAGRLYADIMADHAARLRWAEDYGIALVSGGRERAFAQLSGGEQMAAALAVRLALLKEVSEIDVAFFDEPTANLDDHRRDNLARQILAVKGFSQLFVISHDDTFEQDTDNVVRVVKENGASQVVEV